MPAAATTLKTIGLAGGFLVGSIVVGALIARFGLLDGLDPARPGETATSPDPGTDTPSAAVASSEPPAALAVEPPRKEDNVSVDEAPQGSPVSTATLPVGADDDADEPRDSDALLSGSVASADLLQRADELILEGSYSTALRLLRTLAATVTGDTQQTVRLRIGLCCELVGDLSPAQQQYDLAGQGNLRQVREHALLGKIRCWMASNRNTVAEALYQSLTASHGPGTSRLGDCWHLLAQSVAADLFRTGTENDLDETRLFHSRPSTPVLEILQAVRSADDERVPPPTLFSTEQIDVVRRLGERPQELFLTADLSPRPIADCLAALAKSGGWEVGISELASSQLMGHRRALKFVDLDAAFVLDALLSGANLSWSVEGNRLKIVDSSELSPAERDARHRQRAERALRAAIAAAPDHAWVSHAYLAIGRLAALEERYPEALRYHEQALSLFPDAECRIELLINQGKLLLQLGERDAALERFYAAADSATGHPLRPTAFLYIGRLQLENNRPDRAKPELMRALALCQDGPYEDIAACLLASALLMDRNPHGANAVLMKRRTALAAGDCVDQAAFLSALARYRATVSESYRQRMARDVVEAVAHADPGAMFGGHWWVLCVEALDAVGMAHEARRMRNECLTHTAPFPLRDQLLLTAAQEHVQASTGDEILQAMQSLAREDQSRLPDQTRLIAADNAFQEGNTDRALRLCTELVRDTTVPDDIRRNSLRLMGRIFQNRGDFHAAVACFAGTLPTDDMLAVPTMSDHASPGVER